MKIVTLFALLVSFACASVTHARQYEIVAACIILEAGGEGKQGMVAVYEVMRNRATKRGTTLTHEVLRPKQFSCFNSGEIDRLVAKAKKHPRWDYALLLAEGGRSNQLHQRRNALPYEKSFALLVKKA